MVEWKFICILSNLSLEQTIENEYLAIVPKTDLRVQTLLANIPNFRYLIDGFADQFGREVAPSMILARKNSRIFNAKGQLDSDALIGFRNAVALSIIMRAWQDSLPRKHPFPSLTFSNYFDIYPISISMDNELFLTHTPSLLGADEPKEFQGQCSPELAHSRSARVEYDYDILEAILEEWKKRFIERKKRAWKTLVLFRSLEMAYHACKIPIENNSTIFDIGSRIALWVSAFEILVHPQTGKSDLKRVLDLIGKIKLDSSALSNRYYTIKWRNNVIRGTLIQKMYYELYKLRNDFLHGNPVNQSSLYPFRNKRRPLHMYISLLYKIALLIFLGIEKHFVGEEIAKYMMRRNFEESILSVLNKM